MSGDQTSNIKRIYISLLNEGTDVLRPADAIETSANIYKILIPSDYNPDDEEWEFPPGSIVECKVEKKEGIEILVAKKKVR